MCEGVGEGGVRAWHVGSERGCGDGHARGLCRSPCVAFLHSPLPPPGFKPASHPPFALAGWRSAWWTSLGSGGALGRTERQSALGGRGWGGRGWCCRIGGCRG